jgi:hypothetical protein
VGFEWLPIFHVTKEAMSGTQSPISKWRKNRKGGLGSHAHVESLGNSSCGQSTVSPSVLQPTQRGVRSRATPSCDEKGQNLSIDRSYYVPHILEMSPTKAVRKGSMTRLSTALLSPSLTILHLLPFSSTHRSIDIATSVHNHHHEDLYAPARRPRQYNLRCTPEIFGGPQEPAVSCSRCQWHLRNGIDRDSNYRPCHVFSRRR